MASRAIALGPKRDPLLVDAIESGGARVSDLGEASALVWTGGPDEFPNLGDGVEWVQLGAAGIEDFFAAGILDNRSGVRFTSAAGAFAKTVAEHALTLLLAGVRAIPDHLQARTWQQSEFFDRVGTLRDANVAILGAGGIGRALIPMLAALGAHSIAVNRSGKPVPGAVATYSVDRLDEVWPQTDHVVVAAPATPATDHLLGAQELARLKPTSWVINIARGSLIDTDALVRALREGTIAGAGLDVTDPEPLPDGHPLWHLPNVIVTPHDSNPPQVRRAAFAEHVAANVARFVDGTDLLAIVDPVRGY